MFSRWLAALKGGATGTISGSRTDSAASPLRSKLFQESYIALIEKLNVVDVVLEHRKALHAEPERPAAVTLRIDAAVAQHFRMHHPATHHFQPAAHFANAASFTLAEDATDGDFRARLGERKKTGMKTGLDGFAEELFGKEL